MNGWDELMLPKVWSSKLSAFCPAVNRFTTLMSKNMKRKNDEETDNPRKKFVNPNHWANGLLKAMEDDNLRIHADSQIVVIRDKYPKSLYHFLVLPKESIPSLKDINKGHIDLLEHIHSVACQIAQKKEHRDKSFKMGYHAEPSMNHLHMHLISDDFCFVKTKKHYNSYTTSFFIDSEKLIKSVKETGKVTMPSHAELEELLKQPLKCFKCGETFLSRPKLTDHLNKCSGN